MPRVRNFTSKKSDVTQVHSGCVIESGDSPGFAIQSEGFDYSVTVEIGNFEFPTKTYGDISFPAGCYDALRVKIGSASGQNWWCVMFPPLCFVDVSSGVVPDSSKDDLQNALNDEDYAIISECDNSSDISFKFKLIEFFAEKGLITAKNN